ncbi:ABC-type sugar transport system, periplasmic component [Sphaerochaeta pleomorpha str. Grapes]|uniref:ABC-type sugar transport system, periplasmic component n=1 Tax=Sphaerochaeta pleomorpha (strain ATCC BAA-1885 / DSM 22778 / Grapes) TaxID=158190 RepID=G8QWH2_SPHPG|nr:ABC transporter substrate-binding protein [Sphaerochaeta pleomorpha]AEV30548.1 ABC-type sugar transport system, periplasmic component [Sphaerochaeta pleomorpha str. Grapes]
MFLTKKKISKQFRIIIFFICICCFLGCNASKKDTSKIEKDNGIIVGFSQIGAESAWRTCNTRSVQEAAAARGVQLVYDNAEQKQENQIKALRSFIAYQVDVIVFVPIVTDGWDNVLQEARDAGIPVLVTDRKIDVENQSLYAGFIGTDSLKEGRNAGQFVLDTFESKRDKDHINIVELFGTEGSSVALGRAEGFREVLKDHPEYRIIYSKSGDFLRSRGYELAIEFLEMYDDIDVIYSHNDGMTLGAIEAMEEKGLRPGKDIVIITIDAQQAAIDALRGGKVNCVIECNPKTGPEIIELAEKLAAGESIPRLQYVHEEVFYETDDLSLIEPRGY